MSVKSLMSGKQKTAQNSYGRPKYNRNSLKILTNSDRFQEDGRNAPVCFSGSLSGRIATPQLQDPVTLTGKEYLKARCYQLVFGWQCCRCWVVFARIVELFITDAFVDMFITICIVVNTIFMALDHAGMSRQMAHTLKMGNYVSTHTLFSEACMGLGITAAVLVGMRMIQWEWELLMLATSCLTSCRN